MAMQILVHVCAYIVVLVLLISLVHDIKTRISVGRQLSRSIKKLVLCTCTYIHKMCYHTPY